MLDRQAAYKFGHTWIFLFEALEELNHIRIIGVTLEFPADGVAGLLGDGWERAAHGLGLVPLEDEHRIVPTKAKGIRNRGFDLELAGLVGHVV